MTDKIITLDEAERIALDALLQAEARRQNERQLEADFWTVLDKIEMSA